MPSLKDLFKTKPLSSGKTAEKEYKVRNSKEVMPITSTAPVLNSLIFPFVQKNLRENPRLTNAKSETVLESELVGLRALKTLSFPVTYNREILRLSRQTTNTLEYMKTAANGGKDALDSFARGGIVGKLIDIGEKLATGALSKLGIELPQRLIPSRIAYNKKFRDGLEPDTMDTLAKIQKDGSGNLVGKFLSKNINIGPPKMKIKIGGALIAEVKSKVRSKLFGSPLKAAQNLAAKTDIGSSFFVNKSPYSSETPYSGTVNKSAKKDFERLRGDLSSLLVELQNERSLIAKLDAAQKEISNPRVSIDKPLKNPSPFAKPEDVIKDIRIRDQFGVPLNQKSSGEIELAKPENQTPRGAALQNSTFIYTDKIKYGFKTDDNKGTVFPRNSDIRERKDLSTTLDSYLRRNSDKDNILQTKDGRTEFIQSYLAGEPIYPPSPIKSIERTSKYSSKTFNSPTTLGPMTLEQRGIGGQVRYSNLFTSSFGDIVSSKPPYAGEFLQIGDDGTTLDDKDFITVKFTTVFETKSVNFPAIITGINETFAIDWQSNKFLGSPFEYHHYNSIGRSVSFDLEMYSLNPGEHIIMWEKIDFLTSLVYPISYDATSTFITPPLLYVTLGDMYKKKLCFISQLSYTIDDNAGWEIGRPINDSSKYNIYGNTVDMENYKLPRGIKASITLTFIESRENTQTKKYGYNPINFQNDQIRNV
jgi:hypothetical protein